MNVAEVTRLVQLRIREAAQEEELQQARALVGFVLGIDPAALMLHHGMEVTGEQIALLGALAQRRAQGEPLQYILGEWSFMGLPFAVRPGVLIPRQDTEVLCEAALELAAERGYASVLDLCCGSGCIGISLGKLGGLSVTCADVSDDCLNLTRENAELNGVAVETVKSDLFAGIDGTFDLITCNPPYLTHAELDTLQREIRYEPLLALDGGADGLDFYRRIAETYAAHLNGNGALLLEIGCTQQDAVCAMFSNAICKKDYAGNPRVVLVLR